MSFEERIDAAIEASEPDLFGAVVDTLGFSPYLISGSYLGYQVFGGDEDDEEEGFPSEEDTDHDETMSDEGELDEDKVDEGEEQGSSEGESSDEEEVVEVEDEDEEMGEGNSDEEEEEDDTPAAPSSTASAAPSIITPAIGATSAISAGPSVAVVAAPASTAVSTPHHRCDECARKHKKCVRPSGRGSCQGCLRARGGPKVCSFTQG